jgi:DNA-binding XRE family transcriptional regulator
VTKAALRGCDAGWAVAGAANAEAANNVNALKTTFPSPTFAMTHPTIRIRSKAYTPLRGLSSRGTTNQVRVARTFHTGPYEIMLGMLVEARNRADITQAELAKRIGRPQPFISLVERGERRIDVIQFYAIVKALGLDPEQAFRDLVARLPEIKEV